MFSDQVCFRSNHFLLFLLVVACLLVWALILKNNQEMKEVVSPQIIEVPKGPEVLVKKEPEEIDIPEQLRINAPFLNRNVHIVPTPELPISDRPVVEHVKYPRELNDPYLPPHRYYESYINPNLPINIPTQPYIDTFQKVGFVVSKDNSSLRLPLFGKPKYARNTDKWVYYVLDNTPNKNKIWVESNRNDNELCSGDDVIVPTFDDNFEAHIYDYAYPRYNPHI